MLYSIQFLRFVAAALVVLYHGWFPISRNAAFDSTFWDYATGFGAVGVHIFFVISGFVMVWTQADRFGSANPLHFIWKRLDRIFPAYWLFALLTTITALLISNKGLPDNVTAWAKSLLLFPSYSSQIVSVGWTLSYELFFYACFAMILALQTSLEKSLIMLSAIFLGLISIGLVFDSPPNAWVHLITNSLLIEFLLGAWTAWFFLRYKSTSVWLAGVALTLAVVLFSAGFYMGYDRYPSAVVWGVPSTFLLIGTVLLERTGRTGNYFEKFSTLGGASYSLYLLHMSAIAWIYFCLDYHEEIKPALAVALMIASTSISVFLSILVYRYVEPELKLRKFRLAKSL